MPRGGARLGAGRKPGTRNPLTTEAKAEQVKSLAAALPMAPTPVRRASAKSAVEILREMTNAFYALAAYYQPKRGPDGSLVGGDLKKFAEFGSEAAAIAGRLASFEGPTYSSVRVTQAPPDLSKLTDQELAVYIELTRKSTGDAGGTGTGTGATLN